MRKSERSHPLPGLTNDDEPIKIRFAGFLTEWKVLSAALMKNGLKRRPGFASSSERENSRVHLVKLDLATAAWRRQCAQCAPSCSPQSPYAHAIGPSYQELWLREGLQPRGGSAVRAKTSRQKQKKFLGPRPARGSFFLENGTLRDTREKNNPIGSKNLSDTSLIYYSSESNTKIDLFGAKK